MTCLAPGRLGDRSHRAEWVQRVALRQMTAAQADALRQWCQADPRHGAAFAEAHRLWQGMAPAAALSEARGRERRLSRPARRAFLGAGLACAATGAGVAVVAPPFGLWPSWRGVGADYRTAKGEQRRRIAGAAVLDLEHAHQHRAARRRRRADQRRAAISLAGASSPFTVSAAAAPRRMAQDAVFELRHTDGSVCVTCLSGAVEVALASGGDLRRRGGWSMTRRGPAAARAGCRRSAGLARGFLRFRQAPAAWVLDEINRYRSGRVILMAQSLAARPVSVRVELARLDTAIAQIRENFRLDATALPGGVLLLVDSPAPPLASLPSAGRIFLRGPTTKKTVCFSRVDPSR